MVRATKIEITGRRVRILKKAPGKRQLWKAEEGVIEGLSTGAVHVWLLIYCTVSVRTVIRLPPLTATQDELPGTFLGCRKVIPTVTNALG